VQSRGFEQASTRDIERLPLRNKSYKLPYLSQWTDRDTTMAGPRTYLGPLPGAISQAVVEAEATAWKPEEVVQVLLGMTSTFLRLTEKDTLFAKGESSPDPYHPSLRNLYSRLQAGQLPPSPNSPNASAGSQANGTLRRRTSKALLQRPLEDFEDLYYALLALTQEMHSNLVTRVNNGFSTLSTYFSEGGYQVHHIVEFLLDSWCALNNASLTKALDSAIRHARYKRLEAQLSAQWTAGDYTKADYDELREDLQDPVSYATIQGLHWIAGYSPAMINAQLSQKYRKMFSEERKEKVKKERWEAKKLQMETTAAEEKEIANKLSVERQQHEALLQAQRQQEDLQLRARWEEQQELPEQTRLENEVRARMVSDYMHHLRSSSSDGARKMIHKTGYNVPQHLYGGDQNFCSSSQSFPGYPAFRSHSRNDSAPNSTTAPHFGGQTQNVYMNPATQRNYTSFSAPQSTTNSIAPQVYNTLHTHNSVYGTQPSSESPTDPNARESFFITLSTVTLDQYNEQ
jgi:hypothetical protein